MNTKQRLKKLQQIERMMQSLPSSIQDSIMEYGGVRAFASMRKVDTMTVSTKMKKITNESVKISSLRLTSRKLLKRREAHVSVDFDLKRHGGGYLLMINPQYRPSQQTHNSGDENHYSNLSYYGNRFMLCKDAVIEKTGMLHISTFDDTVTSKTIMEKIDLCISKVHDMLTNVTEKNAEIIYEISYV